MGVRPWVRLSQRALRVYDSLGWVYSRVHPKSRGAHLSGRHIWLRSLGQQESGISAIHVLFPGLILSNDSYRLAHGLVCHNSSLHLSRYICPSPLMRLLLPGQRRE